MLAPQAEDWMFESKLRQTEIAKTRIFLPPQNVLFILFVCLFVCLFGVSVLLRNFHSYGDVTITRERQILTFTRQSPCYLSMAISEGSFACHFYCDTGYSFIWSSPRIRDTFIAERLKVVLHDCTFYYDFYYGRDSNTQPSDCEAHACATVAVKTHCNKF